LVTVNVSFAVAYMLWIELTELFYIYGMKIVG
jgi:hypothetical protein